MPRRSTGCEKCRQRKVRCDETKPRCKRCTDYGVTCPGFRPPAEKDLHFIDQTSHVAHKAGGTITAEQNPVFTVANNFPSGSQLRWRNQFSGDIFTVNGIPGEVSNRHMHRIQLLSVFLDLYLPKRRDPSLMSHYKYVTALPSMDLSTPLLQIAIDTLCLVELGSLYDDQRCLHEASARYVRALPMLAKELAKPKARQLPGDHILAAISILSLCELFDAIAQGNQRGHGWISHVHGAQQYIQGNGPGAITTPLGWLLYHNVRHSSLCMGLVRRKRVFLEESKWLRLTRSLAKKDPYVALLDVCLRAPGVLEDADALAGSVDFDTDFARVCTKICRLRKDLDNWHAVHATAASQQYSIVDLRDMTAFATLCPDRTFVTVFTFPSVQICSQFQQYWVLSLLMDFTFANIYRLHSGKHVLPPVSNFTDRAKPDIWREMYVNATNYCRTVPFCCEPETASVGRIGTFMLRISQSYFRICRHPGELAWCHAVRTMLDTSAAAAPLTTAAGIKIPKPNSSVKCKAPHLPLILDGQYPTCGYTPRLPPPEYDSCPFSSSFDSSSASSPDDTTSPYRSHVLAQGIKIPRPPPELHAMLSDEDYGAGDGEAGPSGRTQSYTFVPESDPGLSEAERQRRVRRVGGTGMSTNLGEDAPMPTVHGASALADERVLAPSLSPGVMSVEERETDEGWHQFELMMDGIIENLELAPDGDPKKGARGAMCF